MRDATPSVGPRRVGRYDLLCRFASGGMADVYLGRLGGEDGVERILALKVIHEHLTREPQFVKMFIDEARLAARISHPNVVLTLELGRVDKTHFIVMEYVEGESLSALLRRTRPPAHYSAHIVSAAAAGLHAAHELRDPDGQLLSVVHRDVSPHNILLSYDGAVKVADFGVARARGSLHTTSGEVKGKFGYMSPEQFVAPNTVDRRTDIFALGIVLYEATTRKRLFKGEAQADTMERVLRGEIPRPSQIVPDYPQALERIVLKALERNPLQRHQTAQELHDELERFIVGAGEPVSSMTIGKMMREVFADRVREKKDLREHALEAGEATVREVDLASGSSVELPSSVRTFRPSRGRKAALVGGVLAVGVSAAVALVLWAPGDRAPTSAGAAGQPTTRQPTPGTPLARTVTIAAQASPAQATLILDGKSMSNPFEVKRPATTETVELVASAPGYRTQRFQVPLARGGTWTVGLVAERPDAGTPHAPPKKKRRGGRGGSYLDNPYR